MSEWWEGFIWGALVGWILTSIGSFFTFALFHVNGQTEHKLDKRIKEMEDKFDSYR